METVNWIIQCLLAATFAIAGLTKLTDAANGWSLPHHCR
jgi:hypothetical protein